MRDDVELQRCVADLTEDSVAVQFAGSHWGAPGVAGLRDPTSAPAFLRAVTRWSRGGREPDASEWQLVAVDDDVGELARVALRGAMRELTGPDDAPLPDVTEKLRGRIHSSYLSWAEATLAAATGRRAHSGYGLDRQLAELRVRSAEWPSWVAAPLGALSDRRRDGRMYAMNLHLRDAAEGVARLLWAALVARAWAVWSGAQGGPGTTEQRAALTVLRTAVTHAFSFGGAVRLCGAKSVGGLWTVEGAPLPPDQPALWRRLRGLAQWRNKMAHGTPSPVDNCDSDEHLTRLVRLLEDVGPWLAALQSWLSTTPRVPSVDGWREVAAPGLWEAPNGALCVLEQIERGFVTVRTPDGARARLRVMGNVGEMLRFAVAEPEIDAPPDDGDAEPMEELVAAAFAAIHGGGDVWLVGPTASGRSTLAWQITRALRLNGMTVLRVRSTVESQVVFSEDLRERIALALRASGLIRSKDGGTEENLPSSSSRLGAWWKALRDANPGASLALVIDAIDLGDNAVLLYESARAHQLPTLFVSDQALQGRPGLVIDLPAWHLANGHALFRSLLRRRHRELEPEHERLIASSEGRIGWLIGDTEDALACAVDPELTPAGALMARLRRIEASYGGHPAFVACLRHVVITLAEVHVGITMTFLHDLLSGGRVTGGSLDGSNGLEGSRGAGADGWAAWLLLALRAAEPLVDSCWLSDETSASVGPSSSSERVWRIANPNWLVLLREGPLSPEWAQARRLVRESLATQCRDFVVNPMSPNYRYGWRFGVLHRLASGEDPSAVFAHVLGAVPWHDIDVGAEVEHWVSVTGAMVVLARTVGRSEEAWVTVAHARALRAAGRSSDALAAIRQSLAHELGPTSSVDPALREAAVRAALADLRPEEALEELASFDEGDAAAFLVLRARVMLALERRAEAARLMGVASAGGDPDALEVRLALALSGHCRAEPDRWLAEARRYAETAGPAGRCNLAVILCGLAAFFEPNAALRLRAEAVTVLREVHAACDVPSDPPRFRSLDCDLVQGLSALTLSYADTADPLAARAALAEAWGLVRRAGPTSSTGQHADLVRSLRVAPERWLAAIRALASATVTLASGDADAGVATILRMRGLLCGAHCVPPAIVTEDAPRPAWRDLFLCDLWLAEALLRAGRRGMGVQLLARCEVSPLVWEDRVLVAALHRAHAAEVSCWAGWPAARCARVTAEPGSSDYRAAPHATEP